MLPVVFKKFELVCIIVVIFSLSLSTGKRLYLAKILDGAAAEPRPFPHPAVSMALCFYFYELRAYVK